LNRINGFRSCKTQEFVRFEKETNKIFYDWQAVPPAYARLHSNANESPVKGHRRVACGVV